MACSLVSTFSGLPMASAASFTSLVTMAGVCSILVDSLTIFQPAAVRTRY
nr:MAG TPA: hypothetical protein [Caudoviricetes sp.]